MALDALAALATEEARKKEKPVLDAAAAIGLARTLYGLDVDASTVEELDSYDDRNFYFRATTARAELAAPADGHTAAAAREALRCRLSVRRAPPALGGPRPPTPRQPTVRVWRQLRLLPLCRWRQRPVAREAGRKHSGATFARA